MNETDLEIQLSLNKNINYQHGSQGFLVNTHNNQYISAESELALEVTRCIELREEALVQLMLQAEALQRADFAATSQTMQLNSSNQEGMFFVYLYF